MTWGPGRVHAARGLMEVQHRAAYPTQVAIVWLEWSTRVLLVLWWCGGSVCMHACVDNHGAVVQQALPLHHGCCKETRPVMPQAIFRGSDEGVVTNQMELCIKRCVASQDCPGTATCVMSAVELCGSR